MDSVLEVKFSGWTATPRMPFILSGNAVCMHTPSYSLLLGIIGCCLGRIVTGNEVKIGFHYSFDSIAKDLETRQRLEFDGRKIKQHSKGTDAYSREFHVSPKLTIWLNRLDWEVNFKNPIGTPSLGRSQDILTIDSVRIVEIKSVEKTELSGCMIPFNSSLHVGGQLVQLAESYYEIDKVGGGRKPMRTGIFISIPFDCISKVEMPNLYSIKDEKSQSFYLHNFGNAS